MKTIKIIDLLNRMANGEEVPEKIKYDNIIWEKRFSKDYVNEKEDYLFDNYMSFTRQSLNREAEIIGKEEEIELLDISRLRQNEYCYPITVEIMAKINELTKAVNEMRADNE